MDTSKTTPVVIVNVKDDLNMDEFSVETSNGEILDMKTRMLMRLYPDAEFIQMDVFEDSDRKQQAIQNYNFHILEGLIGNKLPANILNN